MAYDYLVLAAGATHSYFGHDEWAELAPGLKSVEDATRNPPPCAARVRAGRASHAGARLASAAEFRGHRRRTHRRGTGRRHPRHSKYYMRNDFRHIDPTKAKVLLLDGGERAAGRLSRGPFRQGAEGTGESGSRGSSQLPRDERWSGLRGDRRAEPDRTRGSGGNSSGPRVSRLRRWGSCWARPRIIAGA